MISDFFMEFDDKTENQIAKSKRHKEVQVATNLDVLGQQ
jgi:hypothetical protein